MENITYELNGKKYVLFEVKMTGMTKEYKINSIKRNKGIRQGIKEVIHDGWWNNGYTIEKVLIPEENIEQFSSEIY